MTGTAERDTAARGTRRVSLWRHLANGAALAGILVVAAIVLQTAPSDMLWQSPIPVGGRLGEPVTGRNIRATVLDVRAARTVTAANGWSGQTSGVWVVVDASVEAVVDDFGASLGTAQLQIGNTTYSASTRPDTATLAGQPLSVGIAETGPVMFEVPAELVGDTSDEAPDAQLQFAENSDPRADSLIVVPVDLGGLTVVDALTTTAPVWGVR